MIRKLICAWLLVATLNPALAQDLNARVQLLAPQLPNANKRILDVLQNTMSDFLNGRKWANDAIRPNERIDCNFVVTITDWDGISPNFKAEAQIQSSRPVYNTSYNSTLLNLNDRNFDFSYTEGQAVDFAEQAFTANLSSLLAFYANIIVGFDYDSYSLMGGNPYFTKAQTILNNAQNAPNQGWKAFESLRNRYWLIENLNNKSFLPIRRAMYTYHRLGLDELADNPSKGKKVIVNILPELEKIDPLKQSSMLNYLFFSSKSEEMVNVLQDLSSSDKIKAYTILTKLDPTNISKYEVLKK